MKVYPRHIFLASVSFDYDGVLSTKKGKELAKRHLEQGDHVYIITARRKSVRALPCCLLSMEPM